MPMCIGMCLQLCFCGGDGGDGGNRGHAVLLHLGILIITVLHFKNMLYFLY